MAIQKYLLQDTVDWEKADVNARFGEVYESPLTLTNVRIESRRSSNNGANVESQSDTKTILFYDLKFSKPAGIIFNAKDKITYKNHVYIVKQSFEGKQRGTISHFEVNLV